MRYIVYCIIQTIPLGSLWNRFFLDESIGEQFITCK